jgi:hypothetical protein
MEGVYPIATDKAPVHLRIAAERAAREVADILDLPPLTLRWYRSSNGHKGGFYDPDRPGVIHLIANGLKDKTMTRVVVYHEARHAWQERRSYKCVIGSSESEDDADSFVWRELKVDPEDWRY